MGTHVERFTSDPEGMRLFQQELLIAKITELLATEMKKKRVKKTELAELMGMHRSRVTQMLEGRNLTLRTVADAFYALGVRVEPRAIDISLDSQAPALGDVVR